MSDISELTAKVANHLAGRDVRIIWANPPTVVGAAGQTIKTPDGDLVIYIADLEGINTRFRVLLHEIAHCRHDYGWIPKSTDHKRPAASLKRSASERQRWRSNWREKRAHDQADRWMRYADQNAHRYFRAGRDAMTCKLLALMNWSE